MPGKVYEALFGNPVRLDVLVTTPNGLPDNPAGVKLRIEAPDGSVYATPDDLDLTLNADTGQATCVFVPPGVGVYAYRWWFGAYPFGSAEGIFRIRESVLLSGDV